MFIKRNSSRQGGKTYGSVLLVEGIRVPVTQPPGRPRKDVTVRTRVVHRRPADLSRLPAPLVALIARFCKGEVPTGTAPRVAPGASCGVLAGLHALAGEAGLVAALGPGRLAEPALFTICVHVAWQGSRLAAVRRAEDHAVAAVPGLDAFDEDDLYAALGRLQADQQRIERALAPKLAPTSVRAPARRRRPQK